MALKKNPKYDLKLKYKRVLEISMIVALSFLVVAFKFFPDFKAAEVEFEAPQELVNVEDIVSTEQNTAPPPPPKPLIPIEAPSDDDVLEDIEFDTELIVDEEVAAPPPPPKEEEEDTEPVFFVAVEEMPTPVGGLSAIEAKADYPQIAIRAGVQGRVTVLAFVNENGDVEKVELMKGIGAGCDEAAMAAIKSHKFNPGKQRGRPVKTRLAIPIRFKITS